MSTLTENTLRSMLPQPNVQSSQSQPDSVSLRASLPTIPGTIQNTNPPSSGPGDALIFDPDENITYDALQTIQQTTPQNNVPIVASAPIQPPSSNVLDLQATTAPSKLPSQMYLWVIGIVAVIIISLIIVFLMKGNSGSTPQPQMGGFNFNQLYGQR